LIEVKQLHCLMNVNLKYCVCVNEFENVFFLIHKPFSFTNCVEKFEHFKDGNWMSKIHF
jgi:hypothetical protein